MELSIFFGKLIKGNEGLILGKKKDIVNDLHKKIDKLSQGFKEIQNKPKLVLTNRIPLTYIEKNQSVRILRKLSQST